MIPKRMTDRQQELLLLSLLFELTITHALFRGRMKELGDGSAVRTQAFDQGFLTACLCLELSGFEGLAQDLRDSLRNSAHA